MIRLGKLEGTLLVSFLTLFCFALLYIFRSFDNNTLTSWQWVFKDGGFTGILPYLVAVIILSLVIARYIPLEKYPIPVLAVIAGGSVLPLWDAPELMLDSGRYFLQAKSLSEYGVVYFAQEWGHTISAWTDLPLTPFLYGLALKYGNESRTAIQLLNTIIFVFTVILTYKTGTLLWNRETGFYGGLLLIGMPYLMTQVPQMLVDMHAMFFHLLAVYCFLAALTSTNHRTLFISSATFVLAVFVKFSIWPMLVLLPLSCFFIVSKDDRSAAFRKAAFIIVPAVLTILLIITFKWNVFTDQITVLLTYQRPALRLWGEGLASSFLFQSHPFIALLALYSIYKAYQLRDRRFLVILFYCLLIAVLQIQRIRYTIPLLPFITLMAAYGLVAFREIQIRRLTGCMIVSTSLVILFGGYLPFFSTTSMMNIKRAGEYLNNWSDNVEYIEVVVLPQEKSEGSTFISIPLLDLFTNKKIVTRQAWPRIKPEHLSPYSPLLFTWKQNKPAYYELNRAQTQTLPPLVILSSLPTGDSEYTRLRQTPPPTDSKHFTRHSGIFRYRTFVSVYN